MNPLDLVSRVEKFNRAKVALGEDDERAIRKLYGKHSANLHVGVLGACNGERLGGSVVAGWRLLAGGELLSLSQGLMESLEILGNEESGLIGSVVPLFSTTSKNDICFVAGGRLDGQVVCLDVGTSQRAYLLAPSSQLFWDGVEVLSRYDESEFAGNRDALGFNAAIADVWRSLIPASYDCFVAFSLLRGRGQV